jgi:hypothetical protein
VQHELVEDTELGVLLLLLRELRDGTSEPLSLSESLALSSSESSSESMFWVAKRAASCSTVGWAKFSVVIWRVAWGFVGFGEMIWEGERERPFGMVEEEMRREWRLALAAAAASAERALPAPALGMSRVLSLRPVVGSVTDSRAGSCETW